MQAGKTKSERRATYGARAAARPAARIARRVARLEASIPMSPRKATMNEARKREAASPAAIAMVRDAYRSQCIAHEAVKADERKEKAEARTAKSTVPAEAVSNETR